MDFRSHDDEEFWGCGLWSVIQVLLRERLFHLAYVLDSLM